MSSNLCMVIPSYWARDSHIGWLPGDAVYDHPVPLDCEGTLLRALRSLRILNRRDFDVAIVAVPTSNKINEEVEAKVRGITEKAKKEIDLPIHIFGPTHLHNIHALLEGEGGSEFKKLLQLRGYSNIRNLCLFVSNLLGAEAVILIDDDEVFEDPWFIDKAVEFIGKSFQDYPVYAVAGYYLQKDGDYHIKRDHEHWMDYWDQVYRMNEAFDRYIGQPPRLKETPFVFGGNMVIHRNLFMEVPFDPVVPRGEDIDFLINSRMFGFRFFIDNTLKIKHLPPPKSHPVWRRLGDDALRFLFEREKIRRQRVIEGMTMVRPEDFDPYPGAFLRDDLELKVEKAAAALAEMHERSGDSEGAREALEVVSLMRLRLSENSNPFDDLIKLQKMWKDLMKLTGRPPFRDKAVALFK